LDRPTREAREPRQRVLRPGDRFAELAVGHDVDAGLALAAHDLGDRTLETGLEARFVIGLTALARAQEVLQIRRPYQASDMGGEDAVGRVFHGASIMRGRGERQSVGDGGLRAARPGRSAPRSETASGARESLSLHYADEALEHHRIVAQGGAVA